jgi:ABC-2 type transport system ATP-binding protein
MSSITVDALRKQYGDTVAVDGISFAAEPGQVFGLLGPNGAGKTTTIGCVSGLLRPTAGRVAVMGHDVVRDAIAARQALGVVPQELALYLDLSAADNLAYWGAAYDMPRNQLKLRVNEVLEQVGLADRARDKVATFSGGMKRRLNFGCGIIHRPRVLLLDDPTAGVDTTHYMEEAQELCDRIAIVDHGKLLAIGTLAELRALVAEKDLVRLSGRFDPTAAAKGLAELADVDVLSVTAEAVTIAARRASRQIPAIFAALGAADIQETTLTVPSLESLFIKLTGRELRE